MATKKPKFDRTIRIYGSDIIHAVEWDSSSSVLDVTLKNGQRYRYQEVGAGPFARLVSSKSPGKVFNAEIKIQSWTGTERAARKLRARASHK